MNSKLARLKELLDLAEENVKNVRRNTGILDNVWRITKAEELRDDALRAYNKAISEEIKELQL